MVFQSKLVQLLLVIVIFYLGQLNAWGVEPPFKILATHPPPYEFSSSNIELKGFDIEVVFNRLNKPAKVEFLPWLRAVKITYVGGAMALLSCAHNKTRDEYLYYSDPIRVCTDGYFLRKGYIDPNFGSIEALRGQKIAAVLGYTTQLELELQNLNLDHTSVLTAELALNILIGKRIDVYYSAKEGNEFIAHQQDVSEKIKFHHYKSKDYHLCFSKKWPDSKTLLSEFNGSLARLRTDGSYQKIHNKYR